jgi:pimeloyl-ACP methyl ester carboxylesterase
MSEKYVLVDGISIRYVVSGSGPPVLLIHGLGEFLESWLSNIDALSEYFTVYAIDLPGHGLSEGSKEDYSLAFVVRFITGFSDVMGIQRTSLIGRSLGGPICLRVAMDFPEKVDRLVLVSSGGFGREVPLTYRLAALPLLSDILLGPPVIFNKATLRFGMRRQFHNLETIPEEWIEAALKYLKMPKRNETIRNMLKTNTSIGSRRLKETVAPKMPLVETPTLIIHGTQDKLVPIGHVHSVSNLIPQARLEIIDDCGHNPQLEKPEEFNERVIAFLRGDK